MTVVTLHTQVTPVCREGPAHTAHLLLPVERDWHLVRDLCSEGAGGRGRQAAGLGGGRASQGGIRGLGELHGQLSLKTRQPGCPDLAMRCAALTSQLPSPSACMWRPHLWGSRGEQGSGTLQEPVIKREDRHRDPQMLCYLGELWGAGI